MRFSARFAAAMAGVVVLSGSFALVHGDEPPKVCPETKACQCPEVGVPILSNIPYVSRLFKSVGVVHEPGCEAGHCVKTPCADQLERIGVDFEFLPDLPRWRRPLRTDRAGDLQRRRKLLLPRQGLPRRVCRLCVPVGGQADRTPGCRLPGRCSKRCGRV